MGCMLCALLGGKKEEKEEKNEDGSGIKKPDKNEDEYVEKYYNTFQPGVPEHLLFK